MASLAGPHSGQAGLCENKKAPEGKNPEVKHPVREEEPRGRALGQKNIVTDCTLDISEAAGVQSKGNPGQFNRELNHGLLQV